MSIKPLLYLLLLLAGEAVRAQSTCPVIPLPGRYSKTSQQFLIGNATPVIAEDASLQPLAAFLQKELQRRYHINVNTGTATGRKGAAIVLRRSGNAATGAEGYTLRVQDKGVLVAGAGPEGVFNGIISLLQLAAQWPVTEKGVKVDGWQITDQPRYAWRGLLLDESRHFFGKEKVKELLDWMAYYKLNRFHWHLTDVPGWRLEIRKYPKLTTVGGTGNHSDSTAPARYYTQEDIREIVAYARERYIDIIPEIDMPGHARAANRAYPEFSGGGSKRFPHFTFNPGKEATYQYLANILKETDTLFPSQMVHLGGDEVSFGNIAWDTDTGIQQLMQRQRLPDKKAVELYFLQRMADTLFRYNNKVLAWDEAAGASLPPGKTIICWWRQEHPEQLDLALKKGYSVVLCPRLPLYFDFVQDSAHKMGRKWKNREINTLESVYAFSPPQNRQVLGIQACLWSEVIASGSRLDYMLFPRICALAEVAWTNGKKDFPQFSERVKAHIAQYKQQGIYYYDPFAPLEHGEAGQ